MRVNKVAPWWLIVGLATFTSVLPVLQLGRIQADEVFQYLEPAFWRIHGYGILAWEWHDGLRNWAAPLVISWMLRLSDTLGMTNPYAYRAMVEIPFWLLQIAALWAAYQFLFARLEKKFPAILALSAIWTWGFWILFAGRSMGETFSAEFLIIAMEFLTRAKIEKRRVTQNGLMGGAMLGMSVVMRYGSIVIVLAAILWLILGRKWRLLGGVIASGAIVAIALSGLDWATWGAPLHSLMAYTRFNVFPGLGARTMGVSRWWYYGKYFVVYLPAWVGIGLPVGLLMRMRVGLPAWCAAVYLLAIIATPHKEPRFMIPAIMLLALAGAPGLAMVVGRWIEPRYRGIAWAMALGAGAASYLLHSEMKSDEFRAIVAITRPADVRGLAILGEGPGSTAGYFFIGKPIELRTVKPNEDQNLRDVLAMPAFNRVVVQAGEWGENEVKQAKFTPAGRVGRYDMWAR